MIVINFAHTLTPDQLQQVAALTGHSVERVIAVPSQIDPQQPIIPQVLALVEKAGLSASEWQTLPLLINPPSLNFIAVVLLAELHGRCGYFPAHLRLRPVPGSLPPRYEVAEVINLQAVRDEERSRKA